MLQEIFEYPFLIRIFNSLLFDKEKINLIYSSRFIYQRKHKFTFEDEYFCEESYKNSSFFNCLTNIKVKEIFEFPKSVTHLKFDDYSNDPFHMSSGKFVVLSNTIINLTFGRYFNNYIDECISFGITHITFGVHFNKPIYNCIPNSVTYLRFGYYFNQNIDDLPDSIKYLHLHCSYNKPISKFPSNLKYLEVCKEFVLKFKHLINDDITIISNNCF